MPEMYDILQWEEAFRDFQATRVSQSGDLYPHEAGFRAGWEAAMAEIEREREILNGFGSDA